MREARVVSRFVARLGGETAVDAPFVVSLSLPPPPSEAIPAAAFTAVARALFSLDEAIVKS